MSISRYAGKIKDNRKARGKRYSITAIIRLIMGGLLCGANSIAATHRWGKRLSRKQLSALGFWQGRLLCYSNLTVVLRKIDCDSLCEAMAQMVNKSGDSEQSYRILHIDGKFLNNSNCFNTKVYSQILTAFNAHFRSTYGYEKIEGRDETAAMLRLLDKINVKGKIITADAAFAHEEILDRVVSNGADFAIALKGNEPNLLEYTKQAFDKAMKQNISAFCEDVNYMNGRIEQRFIEVIDMPYEYLNGHRHIRQLCRITRYREQKNKSNSQTIETAYMVTSLSTKFSPEYLLKLNRLHWSCENNLNWVKDNIFLEDKSTISTGQAPSIMSLLRSFAIQIIATISNKITEARELLNANKNLLWAKLATINCDF